MVISWIIFQNSNQDSTFVYICKRIFASRTFRVQERKQKHSLKIVCLFSYPCPTLWLRRNKGQIRCRGNRVLILVWAHGVPLKQRERERERKLISSLDSWADDQKGGWFSWNYKMERVTEAVLFGGCLGTKVFMSSFGLFGDKGFYILIWILWVIK